MTTEQNGYWGNPPQTPSPRPTAKLQANQAESNSEESNTSAEPTLENPAEPVGSVPAEETTNTPEPAFTQPKTASEATSAQKAAPEESQTADKAPATQDQTSRQPEMANNPATLQEQTAKQQEITAEPTIEPTTAAEPQPPLAAPEGTPVVLPEPTPAQAAPKPPTGPAMNPAAATSNQATNQAAQAANQAAQTTSQTAHTAQAPTTPPQDVSSAAYAGKPSNNRGIVIAIIVVAIVVLILGILGFVACNNLINTIGTVASENELVSTDDTLDDLFGEDSSSDSTTETLNSNTREFFSLNEGSSLTTDEINSIQESFFDGASTKPTDGVYAAGVYFVGSDLSAGSYWFEGNESTLSYFFVLEPNSEGTYDTTMYNTYYGHNLMEVEKGEVLIVANASTFIALDNLDETFTSPYKSGVYRVGTDIPAGTYTLGYGSADDYYAYYVMSDLEYEEESYVDQAYFVYGDDLGEITLEEGTYVELYNMTLTSNMS